MPARFTRISLDKHIRNITLRSLNIWFIVRMCETIYAIAVSHPIITGVIGSRSISTFSLYWLCNTAHKSGSILCIRCQVWSYKSISSFHLVFPTFLPSISRSFLGPTSAFPLFNSDFLFSPPLSCSSSL